MSSSSGKSFTGMVLVVLALFGAGGALVDKLRNADDDQKIVDPFPVVPSPDPGKQAVSSQKPGFVGANLADDGTGTLSGNALPGSKVALNLNGKTVTSANVSERGEFSVELKQPLAAGQHILKLQTLGSKKNAPVQSDQQIELNIRKDRDVIVTFLEPGQPPQILQGVEGKIAQDKIVQDKIVQDKTRQEKLAQNKLSKSVDPAAKTSTSPAAAKQPNFAAEAPLPSGSGPSKSDQPNILIKETVYEAKPGQAGQVKLSGTAQAGARLRFSIDDIELGSTVVDKSGAWSFATKQQLSPGGHMLQAEQLNDKGLRIAHAQVPFDRAEETKKPAGETIWDKFTGIFKVEPDPNDPRPPADSSELAKSAPDAIANKKSAATKPLHDKLADGSKSRSQPMATPKKTAVIGNFAFESVSYEANAAGGVLELSGRAIAGSRVRLFKGVREIGEIVANSKGIWTFSKRGKIKSGPHMFKASHVLKSGRIASETRMQYDHVDVIGGAGNRKLAANKLLGIDNGNGDKQMLDKSSDTTSTKRVKGRLASPDGTAVNGEGADHSVPSVTSGPLANKSPQAGRVALSIKPRTKTRKAKVRRAQRARKPRRKAKRRSARKRSKGRYYLSRKNKARYMAKRKRYPKSRRTPARVKVRNGTTLWGYSQHYYGRGRLYPHIRRANRRKIKNPNKIFTGQRIRVPRLNRRKKR